MVVGPPDFWDLVSLLPNPSL